ncbi:MAG: hypothetical protein QG597_2397 [Actinomycetota bacterium]|nr:hypothetical protein [Actinomycetota bacterium]
MTVRTAPGGAPSQPAPLVFSTFFGLLMVLAGSGNGGVAAWIGAALALLAVVAGVFYRPSAVLAVIATAATLAVSDTSVLFAAACGLSATAYLVIRCAVPALAGLGVVTITAPTVIGMVGFGLAAVAAALLPWRLPWVPLLAPALVVGIVVVAWVVCAPAADGNGAGSARRR